ncbi:hypothetical protein ACFOGI_09785 [Virgibacillus xinjiangensis]|uniref:Uncharacterized protein n=1 Tax=Virgibacillus xinjiangensis TaxID=393090 RepID=A0ABV7CVZ1_9BACI
MQKKPMNTDTIKQDKMEGIQANTGIHADHHLLDVDNRLSGDSVDEHQRIEEANASIAQEIIQQTYHNS